MLVKIVGLVVTALLINSCAAGGSDSPAAAPATIVGFDYSGTYITSRVECYNPGLTAVTTYANISAGQSTIVISKNSQATTAASGACTAQINGSVEFMPNGVLNLRSRTVTSATGGACTVTTTLSPAPANTVSPASLPNSYTNGQVFNAITGAYVRNATTGDIAILSTFTNSSSGTDPCYTILVKQ